MISVPAPALIKDLRLDLSWEHISKHKIILETLEDLMFEHNEVTRQIETEMLHIKTNYLVLGVYV